MVGLNPYSLKVQCIIYKHGGCTVSLGVTVSIIIFKWFVFFEDYRCIDSIHLDLHSHNVPYFWQLIYRINVLIVLYVLFLNTFMSILQDIRHEKKDGTIWKKDRKRRTVQRCYCSYPSLTMLIQGLTS